MLQTSVKDEIISELDGLTVTQQQKVLEYMRSVASQLPPGVAGPEFRKFAGLIPKEELAAMAAAIEEDCERIDTSEW
jgi:ethanolamine utilization protein EutP (predicted NTPase)